ncbi:MAG TPA: DUF2059 domain-containing protein [Burkholderiaceae bacterium]|jgi:hypothetical protein|nr:DUF2059 domain-containing protein [Burkholderiaceae bacterium]
MHAFRRSLHALAIATLLGTASLAHAQATPVDADKQKLIDQILTLWHPENTVVMAAQRPATEAMEKSKIALQQARLPQAKQDAAMKDITVDVQKYVDTATPLVTSSAKKNMQTTVVPLLAQNFSVDELKQLLALLQSPVKAKFEKLIPQADQAIGRKVQDEVGPEINKNIQTMTQAVGTKLRIAVTAASN